MQLLKGCEKEYQKRHDEIWPEMVEMLKIHGVISYSIFLDPSTCALYAYLEIEDEERWLKTSKTVVNKNGGILCLILWIQTMIIALHLLSY